MKIGDVFFAIGEERIESSTDADLEASVVSLQQRGADPRRPIPAVIAAKADQLVVRSAACSQPVAEDKKIGAYCTAQTPRIRGDGNSAARPPARGKHDARERLLP